MTMTINTKIPISIITNPFHIKCLHNGFKFAPSRTRFYRFCDEFDTHVLSLNLTTPRAHLMLNLVNLIMFGEV